MGEQHDQPDHQRQIAAELSQLANSGRLAALVIEMVDDGRDTRALAADASEAQVRAALAWSDDGWPWATYREVVMTAVRAGVTVLGGNLPRSEMRTAMADATLDARLPDTARREVAQAVDEGHCGLLKPAQLAPMVRIQIARDQRMAEVIERVRRETPVAQPADAARVIVLHAGEQHVARDRGVPLHLLRLGVAPDRLRVLAFSDSALDVDERRPAVRTESVDQCAGLSAQFAQPSASAP